MSGDELTQNWALMVAALVGLAALVGVLLQTLGNSARGRLARELRHLAERQKAQAVARKALQRAHSRLQRLCKNARASKPRHVDEARDALAGAEAELRLIDDHVLIARNRVRTVILEEYPPSRQARLRRRFLGEDE